jgi:hypothetical protein
MKMANLKNALLKPVTDAVVEEVQRSLRCNTEVIRYATQVLLRDDHPLARAATVFAITGHPNAEQLSSAIELINLSIHRLHANLNEGSIGAIGFGCAGNILLGDYLSSAAFQLLVSCDSLEVMHLVSEAAERACEAEFQLQDSLTTVLAMAASPKTLAMRTQALGRVAGSAAAILEKYTEYDHEQCAHFGGFYCAAQAYVPWFGDPKVPTSSFLASFEATVVEAKDAAQRLYNSTGNIMPFILATALHFEIF